MRRYSPLMVVSLTNTDQSDPVRGVGLLITERYTCRASVLLHYALADIHDDLEAAFGELFDSSRTASR